MSIIDDDIDEMVQQEPVESDEEEIISLESEDEAEAEPEPEPMPELKVKKKKVTKKRKKKKKKLKEFVYENYENINCITLMGNQHIQKY